MAADKQAQDFKEGVKASESLPCTNCTKFLPKKPMLPGLCQTCSAAKLRNMADRCEEREPLPQNLTDLGNMERLVARYGQDFRYSKASGWIRWNGRSWEIDPTGKINEAAYDTARMIRAEIRSYSKDDENLAEIKKAIIAWSKASEARARLDAMVALAQSAAMKQIEFQTAFQGGIFPIMRSSTIPADAAGIPQWMPAQVNHQAAAFLPALVASFSAFLETRWGNFTSFPSIRTPL